MLAGSAVQARAHEVITTKLTWAREVSRIFYRRCLGCHSANGGAFPLTTYAETRPWAQAIKEEVLERRMPPWSAVKGFGEFRNDGGLSQEEIQIVSDWVEGGAPRGDDSLLPQLPAPNSPRPVNPQTSGSLPVTGTLKLKQDVTIAAIRPRKLRDGASVRLVAERPDGTLEPLIWIHNHASHFTRDYYLRTPLRLPAGSRIRMNPGDAGSMSLLLLKH